MADIFELEPVDALAVGTVGRPGERQFFLQARGGGHTVTLACEKFHIQALVERIEQLLEAQGVTESPTRTVGAEAVAVPPLEPLWSVAEMGLGYHEARRRFVIVARQATEEGEGATVRFWATAEQIRAFARHAEEVLAGGRPPCPRCGLPIDPDGHPCPVANGSRPIF